MRQNENSITNKTIFIGTKLEKRNQVLIQKKYSLKISYSITHI